MNPTPKKVLILCTGNSARSIIAEYLLRSKGNGRVETYSAGSHPTGRVSPMAIWVLKDRYDLDASSARSKSWDEFKGMRFDLVITVCDNARESCPIFPGRPVSVHLGSPDPAEGQGSEEERKGLFVQVASQISQRLDLFCALPDEELDSRHVGAIAERYKLDGQAGQAQ